MFDPALRHSLFSCLFFSSKIGQVRSLTGEQNNRYCNANNTRDPDANRSYGIWREVIRGSRRATRLLHQEYIVTNSFLSVSETLLTLSTVFLAICVLFFLISIATTIFLVKKVKEKRYLDQHPINTMKFLS